MATAWRAVLIALACVARLDHPGIVRVDDSGEDEGRHWLRMELMPGREVDGQLVVTLEDVEHGKPAPDGYTPAGWDPNQIKAAVARVGGETTPAEMLRGSSFYFLFLAFFFGAIAGLGLISQLVPFGTEAGIGSVALIGLIVGAIGNTTGRVLSGAMSDNLGRLNVLKLMVVVSAVAMPALYLFGSNVLFFVVGVFAVYYCYGTLLAVFAATSADFYGTKHFGVNYGLLFLAWGIAAVAGSQLAGFVYDTFGNYQYAFFTASGLSLLALGSLLLAKNPRVEPSSA